MKIDFSEMTEETVFVYLGLFKDQIVFTYSIGIKGQTILDREIYSLVSSWKVCVD